MMACVRFGWVRGVVGGRRVWACVVSEMEGCRECVWKHDDCVCVCVRLRCVVVGGCGVVWARLWMRRLWWSMGVGGCFCVRWCLMCGLVCGFVCGVVCVSLKYNKLGAEGGAAMAGAVQHLTSLTTLLYV